MRTLIATAFPVEYALPVMMVAALVARLVLAPVRRFLTGQGCSVNARMRSAEATGIWAMAVAAMLFCLAPVSPAERIHALLMSGFLLQLGVCDVASGWLPRRMTVTFLVAGLLASGITAPSVSSLLIRTLLIRTVVTGMMTLMLLYLMSAGKRRGKPRAQGGILGTGDLWMITGMVAWLGFPGMMTALITALAGFVAWHLTAGTGMRVGGPLGPWLSAGCVLILIQRLYQPLWVV
ncbi:TPA: prepilin peptidase [Salmonella enterica subsp. enterica serovar Montevideo]